MRHAKNESLWRLLGVICCAALLFGCGSKPNECAVSGKVTYQGAPVADGEITFEDVKAVGPTAYARIVGGKYQLRAAPGEKRVRITAVKETGKIITDPALGVKYPERIDVIPAKYNTATTLKTMVDPNRGSAADFQLQ